MFQKTRGVIPLCQEGAKPELACTWRGGLRDTPTPALWEGRMLNPGSLPYLW